MALITPRSKRLVGSALTFVTTFPIRPFVVSRHSRTVFSWLRSSTGSKANPLDPRANPAQKPVLPPSQTPGDLASSSIFEQEGRPEASASQSSAERQAGRTIRPRRHDPSLTAPALDPYPLARRRWERKILIRSLHRRFRTRKSVRLLRTERSSVTKSQFLETSIKKLGPLARQIAGKPIEDAIIQMRFSKKRVAGEVLKHLRYARDEAVVRKGMGLGRVVRDGEQKEETEKENKGGVVILKNGRKRVVEDRTGIYIDQAWVGRGSYGKEPDYRARGQVYTLRPPTTSITVLLREEATRIRLSEEREEKRKMKKAWVPLPDRPVTAQRQYCLW
ncbi:54S ribosomal protein L22, mitochondrial [Xylographa carneopallida]|nr:54S ribosomal protein L22, mitochondrial [Xylographa carneopallida]